MSDIIFKTLLLKGEAGNNIIDIKKTSSDGLVDTYTITRTDGVTTTFEVTNGKSITDIKKTGSTGLVDNYKINYNDGTSSTFSIGNGRGISGIKKTGSTGLVDTYTTTYNDGTTSTFTVTNGKDGKDGEITVDDALSETSTNPVQNKAITNSVNDVKGQIHTNLLNSTAPTRTINGVTFTNNRDGTYTVNGTANDRCAFLVGNMTVKKDSYAKITGCPKNGSGDIYYLAGTNNVDYDLGSDYGSGHIFHNTSNYTEFYTYIIISSGFTCNNLLFKPMVTTDLSAIYDDFVPYTGDSGRLNEDVANLIKGISPIPNSDIDAILNL